AAWRRRWYARDPARRRTLDRPVVSVGNLAGGGKGKTPIVAHIARLLTAQGERPAILSRGYGRLPTADGATVVSDGSTMASGADSRVATALGLATFFRVVRQLGVPRMISADAVTAVPPRANVVAVAGIARPERFFRDLRSAGWNVAATLSFRDHHRFTPSDVD